MVESVEWRLSGKLLSLKLSRDKLFFNQKASWYDHEAFLYMKVTPEIPRSNRSPFVSLKGTHPALNDELLSNFSFSHSLSSLLHSIIHVWDEAMPTSLRLLLLLSSFFLLTLNSIYRLHQPYLQPYPQLYQSYLQLLLLLYQ